LRASAAKIGQQKIAAARKHVNVPLLEFRGKPFPQAFRIANVAIDCAPFPHRRRWPQAPLYSREKEASRGAPVPVIRAERLPRPVAARQVPPPWKMFWR